jgi:hypothetical protein
MTNSKEQTMSTRKQTMRPVDGNADLLEVFVDEVKVGWIEVRGGKTKGFLGEGFRNRLGEFEDKPAAAKAVVKAYDEQGLPQATGRAARRDRKKDPVEIRKYEGWMAMPQADGKLIAMHEKSGMRTAPCDSWARMLDAVAAIKDGAAQPVEPLNEAGNLPVGTEAKS